MENSSDSILLLVSVLCFGLVLAVPIIGLLILARRRRRLVAEEAVAKDAQAIAATESQKTMATNPEAGVEAGNASKDPGIGQGFQGCIFIAGLFTWLAIGGIFTLLGRLQYRSFFAITAVAFVIVLLAWDVLSILGVPVLLFKPSWYGKKTGREVLQSVGRAFFVTHVLVIVLMNIVSNLMRLDRFIDPAWRTAIVIDSVTMAIVAFPLLAGPIGKRFGEKVSETAGSLILVGISLSVIAGWIAVGMTVPYLDHSIAEAASQVCSGTSLASAASYDAGADQSHPIVIIDAEGKLHQWQDEMSTDWWPQDTSQIQLVACVGEQHGDLLGTCSYSGGTKTSRVQHWVPVSLIEAQTGNVLGTTKIYGSAPGECADRIQKGQSGPDGSRPSSSSFEKWLLKYTNRQTVDELEANRQKWQSSNISHYRFSLNCVYGCGVIDTMPWTIEVEDEAIIDVADTSGEAVNVEEDLAAALKLSPEMASYSIDGLSIEHLFTYGERALQEASSVTVEYHPEYGLPARLGVTWGGQDLYATGSIVLEVSDFEALP